ncbi:phosphate ABC transporter substrate-binding protein PstS [Brasilonema octagenarum]|uniref:Phosphate-binding protein n=1 Tax=Brasilonema octagenarum UFV-OR1 TaxID=417115 RepID=A0ABX1M5J7_9CYAN|nr:phosphate ABC transporter substrate-binding protein PstS [Brasilonema octagenarum]NMF62264.1 phosphate ABC transporter substrate-binding protein PstS [Brasilonema octagenarum UFV-OR1]
MTFSTNVLSRVVSVSVVTGAISFGAIFGAFAQAETLNGAGATFPAPLYERYAREVKKKYPDLTVNYQAVGSGAGVNQVIAGTVQFGASDSAMTDAEMGKVKNGVILVPTAGGAVAVVHNLPIDNLKLSRKTLPAIFSGQITKWDDPQIKADNPGVNLPSQPIKAVVRADSSGTSFIFTNHLTSISPYFKGRVGTSKSPSWTIPNVIKAKGNPGVASSVTRTPGAIGYVEYEFALKNKLKVAQIRNKQGQFVAPSLQTANQALSTVSFPANFRVFVDDPTQGYPIVGLTWLLIYKSYPNAAQGTAVKNFVNWVLTDGQQINDDLNYTRIPDPVAQKVIQTVNSAIK